MLTALLDQTGQSTIFDPKTANVMPIVIKELTIRATIDPNATAPTGPVPAAEVQQLVEQCVAQVLAILQEKDER